MLLSFCLYGLLCIFGNQLYTTYMKFTIGIWCIGLICTVAVAQTPPKPASVSAIQDKLERLDVLAKVLYVAAHPDDENTKLLSYFHQARHARTAYLSLTRGDGGQNLIGPELRDALGLIRTHELLKAREQDGAMQFFTRANDFGYSKNPDETYRFWDKEAILHDMVWVIRQFQPDIIITRFDPRTPGTTHGHHTASAQLAQEAMVRAADWKQFTDQLIHYKPHQTDYLFYNTSYWAYGGPEAFAKVDKSNWLALDLGPYYPTKGLSNGEIAAKSRSQHQSQGFGMLGTRGESLDYLEPMSAEAKRVKKDVFEHIDLSWRKLKGGAAVQAQIDAIRASYQPKAPELIIPALVKLYSSIEDLIEDPYWRTVKLNEVQDLIVACTGLYAEATTTVAQTQPGAVIPVELEVAAQWKTPVKWRGFTTLPQSDWNHSTTVAPGSSQTFKFNLALPVSTELTQPYWLKNPRTAGLFQVDRVEDIGKPLADAPVQMRFHIEIEGKLFHLDRPVTYKTNDRVKGEIYQPLTVSPPVSLQLTDAVRFAKANAPFTYRLQVTAMADKVNGSAHLLLPAGWKAQPEYAPFTLHQQGESQLVEFQVTPSTAAESQYIQAVAMVGGQTYDSQVKFIRYDHIPHQMYLEKAKGLVHTQNIQFGNERVAYVMGAGDQVGECLQKVGYQVDYLLPHELTPAKLAQYDALILGVRALNVHGELALRLPTVWEWAKAGNTVILQYNTLDTKMQNWSPYPLKLSRDRITEENSPVHLLQAKHRAMTTPNAIGPKDFDNWVQERGLYFPNQWATNWQPLLRMNDTGEKPTDGALLVAQHGQGHIVYTGLSFFRELPEGVVGAYKLFANLLSLSTKN